MKQNLTKVITAFVIMLLGMLLPWDSIMAFSPENTDNARLIVFLIAYFFVGGSVIKEAVGNIGHGQIFDENFLMTLATVGAFFVGEYPEAVAVMLFYQVGEMFQDYAVNRSRKSIAELMDIRPDSANKRMADGSIAVVKPKDVAVGDIIVVRPGEKVPLDGTVIKGNCNVDTAALTGESLPRSVTPDDAVISGCIVLDGVIEVKVDKLFKESTVSKILKLVENASDKKAETENFITRFARVYTPIVVALAVLLALIPPLVFHGDWNDWIYRALTFLVVSCPCALVISVPLSFFGGIGAASSKGVLIKGSNYLEQLAECKTVVFDKTGTLTEGRFTVVDVQMAQGNFMQPKQLLKMAAYAENYSTHPISQSLKQALREQDRAAYDRMEEETADVAVEELAGHGIKAHIDQDDIYVGNGKLMDKIGVSYEVCQEMGTAVYVATQTQYLGCILIRDQVKPDSKEAISQLKSRGVANIVMLTGDREEIASKIASDLDVPEYHAKLLPEDKVAYVEKMLSDKENYGILAFVGDGINDAPVLARADVGVAMGALGSDAAIEAADVVLMDDNPKGIAKAMDIARKTVSIVKQNIIFAIGVKILILILAAFGLAPMWLAIFADVGVAVIAILNALRCLKV
jgi:Cd2+/Zn2+-exporting ATPase